MPVGTVTKYNGLEKTLFDTANRQWNDATAGNIMFCLAKSSYTPSATHSTVANLGTSGVDYIVSPSDGAPVAATSLSIDNTTTPGVTYYDSDDVDFGATVTITAKYLVCVQPTTANTFASTSKLLWYCDLDTTSASSSVSSVAAAFKVFAPTNGWFKTT